MGPGDSIDLSGTVFDANLLDEVLDAVKDPSTGKSTFGLAAFRKASFGGATDNASAASFADALFQGDVDFGESHFGDGFSLEQTEFLGGASFWRAKFSGDTFFEGALFRNEVNLRETDFDWLLSNTAQYFGNVDLTDATLREIWLLGAVFHKGLKMHSTTLQSASPIGPFMCLGELSLYEANFPKPTTLEVTARRIACYRTTWGAVAKIKARHAQILLEDPVLSQPLAIVSASTPFDDIPPESFTGTTHSGEAKIVSLDGVDCAWLTLSNLDLSSCRFDGALHLDQLRLEGRWIFSNPPQGTQWQLGIPFSWNQRQVIEEERMWRALPSHPASLHRGWGAAPEHPHDVPSLASLAIIYRQLRKGREDAKDEPGAADFYYGEMEMRRHSRGWGTAERWLLQAYWLLSGYGLRASRALGWLTLAMMTTILLMMGFGLPQNSPKQEATGTVPPGGGTVTFEIDKDDPKNPTGDRFTGERFDKALSVTLNSVVFRSSGEELTTAGRYIEMASRFSEPVLLGLAALAIRGRVKR
ncbi:pentapeptide repeat-containing protein [Streptomyces sp. NPDC057002]|uniref:pentapeptide repeat-containing protein n=1 Tax=Streptomyces sp. NPDC057002 TaxID=3345992 RepID=UPI00362EF9A3